MIYLYCAHLKNFNSKIDQDNLTIIKQTKEEQISQLIGNTIQNLEFQFFWTKIFPFYCLIRTRSIQYKYERDFTIFFALFMILSSTQSTKELINKTSINRFDSFLNQWEKYYPQIIQFSKSNLKEGKQSPITGQINNLHTVSATAHSSPPFSSTARRTRSFLLISQDAWRDVSSQSRTKRWQRLVY